MVYETHSQDSIRGTFYDKVIKQTAMQSYKFKQAVSIVPSNSWKNYFFRESTTPLAGSSGNQIKGIPRGAEFPQASVSWEQVSSTIEKYGLEDTIPYEDIISNEIDVRDRTLIRIAEGVAKAVDDEIYSALTEADSPTNIQYFTITTGYEWDTASAAIIDDLEQAEEKIADYFYPTDELMVFVSPYDKRKIVNYLYEKGAQAPQLAMRAVDSKNGVLGSIGNKTFIVSNSVAASRALIVVPKRCATWKSLIPLGTEVKERKFKDVTITACEMGVTQLTDPKAIVLIKNTQKV